MVTTKIEKPAGVMRRLIRQLLADVVRKLYYSLKYSHLTYALLAWEDRDVLMLLRLSVLSQEETNYKRLHPKYSHLTLYDYYA